MVTGPLRSSFMRDQWVAPLAAIVRLNTVQRGDPAMGLLQRRQAPFLSQLERRMIHGSRLHVLFTGVHVLEATGPDALHLLPALSWLLGSQFGCLSFESSSVRLSVRDFVRLSVSLSVSVFLCLVSLCLCLSATWFSVSCLLCVCVVCCCVVWREGVCGGCVVCSVYEATCCPLMSVLPVKGKRLLASCPQCEHKL